MSTRWEVLAGALLLAAAPGVADECRTFLLNLSGSEITIEPFVIPEGEMRVLRSSRETGLIDVVMPPGPGGSGSVASVSDGRMHVLRCRDGVLSRQVRTAAGKTIEYPSRAMSALALEDVRVSVVGGNELKRAFLISRYETVEADAGPVQNLFASVPIPLTDDDFILTTETSRRQAGPSVEGAFEIVAAGHLFARATTPAGASGWFVIDTGGAQTLVSRSFLPETTEIREAAMVEHSAAGRRLLEYAPGGATGAVRGILGHADIPVVHFGEVAFEHVTAAVIEEIPAIFGRPVAGILGLDLLRRGGGIRLEVPAAAAGAGMIRLGRFPQAEAAAETGFTIVNDHIVLPVHVGDLPAHMILDTGAPTVLLDSETARAAGIVETEARAVKGLDGKGVRSATGSVPLLRIGALESENVEARVAPLTVFDRFRSGDQHLGLLGNEFLGRFSRVEIDFASRRIRFFR